MSGEAAEQRADGHPEQGSDDQAEKAAGRPPAQGGPEFLESLFGAEDCPERQALARAADKLWRTAL